MDNFSNLNIVEEKFLTLLDKFAPTDKKLIMEAVEVMKTKHKGQLRDEGTAYEIHPIRIATTLIETLEMRDKDTIIAALLHDAIEDTNLTLEEIKKLFGGKVADMVSTLTRDKEQETKQEKFEKTLKADLNTRTIKVCDWLDNMRSWKYIQEDSAAYSKLPRWKSEAKTMYIPLAETVNQKIADEMESLLLMM